MPEEFTEDVEENRIERRRRQSQEDGHDEERAMLVQVMQLIDLGVDEVDLAGRECHEVEYGNEKEHDDRSLAGSVADLLRRFAVHGQRVRRRTCVDHGDETHVIVGVRRWR